MKTTVEIHDVLLDRAKRHARERGKTLRQVIEAGLRAVLDEPPSKYEYDWPDLSVGEPGAPYPLDAWTWQDLSELIYRREPGGAPPDPAPPDPAPPDPALSDPAGSVPIFPDPAPAAPAGPAAAGDRAPSVPPVRPPPAPGGSDSR